MTTILTTSALLIAGLVTGVWLLSLIKRDAGIMDAFWGLGFILIAGWQAFMVETITPIQSLLVLLISVWGMRLSAHITVRNAGHPEDARYKAWREENGRSWWWKSYLKVFLLQGVVMLVIALPIYAVFAHDGLSGLTPLLYIGASVFAIGILFEAVADWQLLQFKRQPENKGKILDRGLWGLSRHPNYFGEAVLWWGLGLIALSTGAWWAMVSPVLMTFLLLKVSGVSMLDELLSKTRPAYNDYMATTPAFLPLGRKRS